MAHRRRWLFVLGGLVLLLAVVVGVPVALYLTRDQPGPKSVDEAVEEYERGSDTEPDGQRGVGPEPGVYEASGEGVEAISFPPVRQQDGEVVPITVEDRAGGCWQVKASFNAAHWQTWTFCEDDGGVVERGGETYQRWDFGATSVENTSTFRCDPPAVTIDPGAAEGDRWDQSCTGSNTQVDGETTSSGPYTYVATEVLEVDGRPVETRRHHQERTIAGAQTGTNVVEVWFAVDDHIPIRMERTVRIDSDSPVGTVTYTEEGTWQLTSLVPRTSGG